MKNYGDKITKWSVKHMQDDMVVGLRGGVPHKLF